MRAQVAINTRAVLELAGRTDVEVALGREIPLVRPLETTPETHGPQGLGHAELPPPTRAALRPPRGRPHPRRGPPPAGRDHARHARAADQPRPRGPARAGAAPACSRLRADGRRVRRLGQHDPDDRVEHPLRPGGGEDRLPGVGRRARGRPDDPAAARARARRHRAGPDPARRRRPARPAGGQHARTTRSRSAAARTRCWPTRSVASNPIVRYVADALRFYMEFHARYDGFYGAFIHDPLAVAAALDRTPGDDRGALRRRRDPRRAHGRDDRRGPATADRPAAEPRCRGHAPTSRRSSTGSSSASEGWRPTTRTCHARQSMAVSRPGAVGGRGGRDEPGLAAGLRGGPDDALRRARPARLSRRPAHRRRPARDHRAAGRATSRPRPSR